MNSRTISNLANYRMRSSTVNVADCVSVFADSGNVQSFAPKWEGFAVSPAGELCYVDCEPVAVLWAPLRAVMAGESNAVTLAITNLPPAIRPRAEQNHTNPTNPVTAADCTRIATWVGVR